MNATLTPKALTVLASIAKSGSTRDDIAAALGVSVPVVNGSLTSLKRNGLVEIDDETGNITRTPDADPYLKANGKAAKAPSATATKMDQARAIFNKYVDKGRQIVLEHFRTNVGLTQAGASTYYQTLRHENELAGMAFQKSKKAAAKKAAKTVVKRAKKS